MTKIVLLVLAVLGAFQAKAQLPTQTNLGSGWRISRTEWFPQDEEKYVRYIAQIGAAVSQGKCSTVSNCFRNPSINPYASTDPKGMNFYSDCADFPYFLRAYFAWRNELPFGFITAVAPIQPDNGGERVKDSRYSPFGNTVVQRYSVIPQSDGMGGVKYPNAKAILGQMIPNQVDSGNFRVSYSGMDNDKLFSDFYPIKLNRDAIRPGSVIYDPNGHVVTVYKITDDGRLYYIDSHPDNSVTSGIFNSGFMRSYPGQGAGFKNWRPVRLEGASFAGPEGGYTGGRLVAAKDRELPLYSTEQFYGTSRSPNWREAKYNFNGQDMSYYDFIRNRMANGPLVENPIDDVRVMVQEVCNSLRGRVDAVKVAMKNNFWQNEHPDRLPKNIFGADGDWEVYASPARDARLKSNFKEIRDYVEEALTHNRQHDGKVAYQGGNMAADLLKAYTQEAQACKITYTNSAGKPVQLNFEQVRSRVYNLSFDPYHCIELRWGATGQELSSCPNNANKRAWYQAEQWMRFQHERNTDAFTGFSLSELDGPKPGAGVPAGQDLDIIAFLTRNQ